MELIRGLKNGMVLQRDMGTNACKITISLRGVQHPQPSLGKLEHLGGERYRQTGIPVGGPYALTLADGTRRLEFADLWVGDVWLLGGQSNMEGWGERGEAELRYDEAPLQKIRAFYLDDHWESARSQLHLPWTNHDTALAEKFLAGRGLTLAQRDCLTLADAGVGPGLFIGQYLCGQSGVPQGLIPCAFGGTCMQDWLPENLTPTSQYRHTLRRFWEIGGNVRGMLWYQGESDLNWLCAAKLHDRMEHMVSAFRKDFDLPELPFVQVQIGRTQGCDDCQLDRIAAWHKIRCLQAEMRFPLFATVSAANATYQDTIHLDTPSQRCIGKAAAMQMCALLGREELANPVLKHIEIRQTNGHLPTNKTSVVLTYDHVIGELRADGAPSGFSVTLFDEIPYLFPNKLIHHVVLRGNQVEIVTGYSAEQLAHAFVWHGAGPNALCNVHDAEGRALLAMGPVPVCTV